MIDKLKKTLLRTVQINAKGYILVGGIFLAGVILSAILNISSGSEEEIKLYINDFISNVKSYSTNSAETFRIAMSGYIRFAIFAFLMSVTVIGNIGLLMYVLIKGFSYGAVFTALSNTTGSDSILFFLSAILPHILIAAPCCICYLFYCAKKSYSIFRGTKDIKQNVLFPLLYGGVCVLLLSVSALIQAYIEPIFIRFINF